MKTLLLFLISLLWIIAITNAQNNALDFDGTDEYVATTSTMNLAGSGDDITLEAWIYIESFPDGEYDISSIIGMEDDANGTALIRLGDPGESLDSNKVQFVLSFYLDDVLTQNKLNGTTALSTNTWYHVTATFKKTTLDGFIYINGVQDAHTYLGYENNFTANDEFYIGAISGPQRYFDGKIDEVRVWSTPRTQAEIRANMYKEISNPSSESDLVAYYQLDETTGLSAVNAEGTNTYDGTLYNMENADWLPSSAFFGPKNALNFDGGLQAVSPDYAYKTSNVTSATDNFTMMAWVYPDVVTNGEGGWRCIAYNGDDAGGYGIGIENSKVAGLFGTTQWNITDEVLTIGNWYHITMRRSGGTVQFFLNGELLGYSNATAPYTPNAKFSIGNMYSADGSSIYTDSFDGKIDEVRVYDAALSDQQIIESLCTSLEGDETNLVAYYNFDNSSGTTLQAFDGSTGNDLTLVNMDNEDWTSSTAFNTWLNVDNTNWANATNWSDGSIPTLTDNVGIPNYSGGSQPTSISALACNNLVVGDDAELTFDYDGQHTIHGSAFVIGHSDITNGDFLTITKNLHILLLSSLDIDPGGQLTIGNNLDIWATGTCTVKSDANGTGSLIVSGNSSGNVIFKRWVHEASKAATWHYVSAPVAGQALNTVWMNANNIAFAEPAWQFFRWDEPTNYWIIYGSTGSPVAFGDNTFVEARGYCLTRTSAGELSFTGTVRTSDLNYGATYTAGEGDGFNLVGNPFTSSLMATTTASATLNFLTVNTALLDDSYEALYIWDEQAGYSGGRNDYKVISNGTITGYTKLDQHYVSPGQAFMVKVVSLGGDLAFNENMQAHNDATFYKNSEDVWPSVELIAENNELFNSTAIGFNENMTLGLDPSYDVGKLKGNPDIALYTKLIEDNGVDFAIQALPCFEQDYSVKVGLDIANTGEYTFEAATMEQIPDEVYVYFEDKLTGTITNLKETDNYTCVISEAGSITNRFVLHFTLTPFSTEETNANQSKIQIWSANKTINILNPEQQKGTIRIINMFGQLILQTNLNGNTNQEIHLTVPVGYYLVNVISNKRVVNRKVLVE